jgi:hypothetical protein
MESQRSKFVESIYRPFYNISPVPGSVQLVLVSPDTEKAAPRSQRLKFPPALFRLKTWLDRVIKTALSSSRCVLQHIKRSVQSHQSFIERWAPQVAHSSHKRGIREIHPAVPIIDRISLFQVHGIHLDTVVQYFSNCWVLPTCSDISRH